MRRLSPSELSPWLAGPGLFPDDPRWGGRLWILHAMYENPLLPDSTTYDDLDRLAEAGEAPASEIAELRSASQLIGTPLGRTRWPGPGWRRLRWTELGARLGVDPISGRVPSFRSFPWPSWPISIAPPGEGSLDREQLLRLVEHIAASEPHGRDAPCCAFYDLLFSDEGTYEAHYAGALGELIDLFDDDELPGSPTEVWPADRSWFFRTDPDQWGTTVCGPVALMRGLADDPELEAVPVQIPRSKGPGW